MPVTYTIDGGTIRTRCYGDLTLEEVIQHFHALESDPNCPRRLHVLLDVSEIQSTPSADQIFRVADEVRNVERRVKFDACAIVAGNDAMFGMMRMFEAMAQKSFRVTNTFRTALEAEAWLHSQIEEDKASASSS